MLGLKGPALLSKRAIQFGTRVKSLISPKAAGSDRVAEDD